MTGWPRVTIESIKAETRYSLVGGPFGSELTTRDYVEDGVPVIRGVNLPEDALFKDDDFVFVRDEKADQLTANNAYPEDVIFTQRGTLGQVGIIPIKSRFARYVISQSQMKLTVNPKKVDARFVYYFFRHPNTVQTIKNRALTSGVPHINLRILREFEIPLPPMDVQSKIVAILATYDNLMENNRRRMALLEAAARQVYCEWFIRLRFPGHEHTRIIKILLAKSEAPLIYLRRNPENHVWQRTGSCETDLASSILSMVCLRGGSCEHLPTHVSLLRIATGLKAKTRMETTFG